MVKLLLCQLSSLGFAYIFEKGHTGHKRGVKRLRDSSINAPNILKMAFRKSLSECSHHNPSAGYLDQ